MWQHETNGKMTRLWSCYHAKTFRWKKVEQKKSLMVAPWKNRSQWVQPSVQSWKEPSLGKALSPCLLFQVRAVGTGNPYRLRPLVGVRMPLNSSYSPLIQLHNPHPHALQVRLLCLCFCLFILLFSWKFISMEIVYWWRCSVVIIT